MADPQRRLVPNFYQHADHGPVVEIKTGPEAGADTIIEKVTAEHARMFPEEYSRFERSNGMKAPEGTSLRKIPGIDDQMVSILSLHGIVSAERFAELNDAQAGSLMPNASIRTLELRDVARLVVGSKAAPQPAPADPVKTMEQAGEIEELKAKLATAERDRDAALELATGGSDDHEDGENPDGSVTARRGPGRPRKN